MSRCLKRCENGRNIFTFIQRRATFQEANNQCKRNGGELARNLDGSSYAALLSCCRSRDKYWIGLKNVNKNNCENSNKPGFQWIGSRTCTDGGSLGLHAQPPNDDCKAVTIEMYPSDTNPDIPRVRVETCKNKDKYYICQNAKQNGNPNTRTTTEQTTRIKISKSSTSVKRISSTASNASISNKTEISTVLSSETIGSNSAFNVWAIAGILAICFLLLFLVAFLIYRRQSRKFLSQKMKCFYLQKKTSQSNNESNQTKIDETYYKLVFVIFYKY